MNTATIHNLPKTDRVIAVEIKSVYGQKTVYPRNEAAELFAQIAGTRTLTHSTLCLAERLGYSIVATADAPWRI